MSLHLIFKEAEPDPDNISNGNFNSVVTGISGFPDSYTGSVSYTDNMLTLKPDLNNPIIPRINEFVDSLRPWKKGPITLHSRIIESEWRSDFKFNFIQPRLGNTKGKTILDIGCNNGYYLYRLGLSGQADIIGIDPTLQYYRQYCLLKKIAGIKQISYYLCSHSVIGKIKKAFDLILCMGIIYHCQNPAELLLHCRDSLKKKGRIIIESQGIPGKGNYAIIPEKKYAGANGIWFVPTADCLTALLKRTGYRNIEVFHTHVLTAEEQRTTADSPGKSLPDFLDNNDNSKTIEGYPAPVRIYISAEK